MDKRDELIKKLEEMIKLWENLSIMNGSIGYIAGLNKIDELQLIIASLKAEIKKEKKNDNLYPANEKWIIEIIDKTNAFAIQLIKDHFNKRKSYIY
jgi:hypothetical protein